MEYLVTVERAKALIASQVRLLEAVTLPLSNAAGARLAHDVVAPLSIPVFDQSNMDGYAFAFEINRTEYTLVGERAAGSYEMIQLPQGTAVRIFTGAALPAGTDTVLIQEKAEVKEGVLFIRDPDLKPGDNVRKSGAEISKGEVALEKGVILQPAAIGFLSGMGLLEACVIPRPRVSIVATGNELRSPGQALGPGQVYDSNSIALYAVLKQIGIVEVKIFHSKDEPGHLTNVLREAAIDTDLILVTGGVSVGDYDFTAKAFEANGVHSIFHRVRQKPGKPLLFGVKEEKVFFGLPGNPASVLTCFYEFVLPAIERQSLLPVTLKAAHLPITHDHNTQPGLTKFIRARNTEEGVTLMGGQESFKMSAFAKATCLAVLPEAMSEIKEGDIVEVHLLPG